MDQATWDKLRLMAEQSMTPETPAPLPDIALNAELATHAAVRDVLRLALPILLYEDPKLYRDALAALAESVQQVPQDASVSSGVADQVEKK